MGSSTVAACLGIGFALASVAAVIFGGLFFFGGGGGPGGPIRPSDPFLTPLSNDPVQQRRIRSRFFEIFDRVGAENIRAYLQQISQNVHVAGTPEQLQVNQIIAASFRSSGLEVKITPYDMFLSLQDYENPNTIEVVGLDGIPRLLFDGLATVEDDWPQELVAELTRDPKQRVMWSGFSPSGDVTAQIVYANYGRPVDFDYLISQGIDLTGKLILVRWGGAGRLAKVKNSEAHGALGVMVFEDPDNVGLQDYPFDRVYPDTDKLSGGASEMGSFSNIRDNFGDTLTPFYPAKPYTFRTGNEQEAREGAILPNIPVMPIGYHHAETIFAEMDGNPFSVPQDFIGGLVNNTYKLTGSSNFRLAIRTDARERRIENVCGWIKGHEEPDRIVMLGAHADAWTYGALDSNSGVAPIMEIGRVLGLMVREGSWRPRRTIMLCTWDGEESGLTGSGDFIEEYIHHLQGRMVAHLNIDTLISGNITLVANGVPLIFQTMANAAGLVENPVQTERAAGRATILDTWQFYYPNNRYVPELPNVLFPGASSDHYAFLNYLGVPAAVPRFTNVESMYTVYHTAYDNFWTLDNLIDNGFHISSAGSKMLLEMIRDLAHSLIIPFNVVHYSRTLSVAEADLDLALTERGFDEYIPNYQETMAHLKDSIRRFDAAAGRIQGRIEVLNSGRAMATLREVEQLNSRLTALERAFINPRGLHSLAQNDRHVIYGGRSSNNEFTGLLFAGVTDAASYYLQAIGNDDAPGQIKWLKQTRLAISEVQFSIESAILILNTEEAL